MLARQVELSRGFLGGAMHPRVPHKQPKGGPLYAVLLSFTHKEGRA